MNTKREALFGRIDKQLEKLDMLADQLESVAGDIQYDITTLLDRTDTLTGQVKTLNTLFESLDKDGFAQDNYDDFESVPGEEP